MNERLVIRPPEIIEFESPVIFLAGPIQGAPNWQDEAIVHLNKIDSELDLPQYLYRAKSDFVIACPRKDYPEGTFVYENQVDWETHYLKKAGELGVVSFWLAAQSIETPGRSYAQTSRFELAEWKKEHQFNNAKIVIGIESGFGNERYIRRRFNQDCPEVDIVDDLEELCLESIKLLNT